MIKKIALSFLVFVFVVSLSACRNRFEPTAYEAFLNDSNPVAYLEIEDYGTLEIQLFPEVAPNTVGAFIHNVEDGLYQDSSFHFVVDNLLIQGGYTSQTACPIDGEFKDNEFDNPLMHTRGVISMSRSENDFNSATTEFFIAHQDITHLDEQYAAFGALTDGFDVLDAIATSDVNDRYRPLEQIIITDAWVEYNDYQLEDKVCYEGFYMQTYEAFLDDSNPVVTFEIDNYGTLQIELFPEVAPNTVDNFIAYVQDGFYVDKIFHRVIEDFMIQGGDGSGTAACAITGEFLSNGFENPLLHTRGVISMARTSVRNSATSQFFIVHKTSPHLDEEYAAFGVLYSEYFDVLDTIATVSTDSSDKPLEDIIITSASVELNGYSPGSRTCAD